MEQPEAPTSKQNFIYKKNPASAAKAITRKMRQSQVLPQTQELQVQRNKSSLKGDSPLKQGLLDGTRSSHFEAETMATQGQPISNGQTFNRPDSEVIAMSGQRRPIDNRRFITQRQNASAANKYPYYEDNIDSETEVLQDPQFEPIVDKKRQTADQARNRKHAKEQFPNPNASMNSINSYTRTGPQKAPMSQDEHFRAIDAVINSNADASTKQRMIADIQDKFRDGSRFDIQKTQYKPRNQKKFPEDDPDEKQQRRKKQRRSPDPHDSSLERKDPKPLKGRKPGRKNKPEDQAAHDNMLLPEMREFSDEPLDKHKRNYLTQDENSDSRVPAMPKKGQNKKFADSEDDDIPSKMKQFTPGRIRASRMGTKKDNFVGSPNNNRRQDRAQTQEKFNKPLASAEDSMQSAEELDYNEILPAVKVRPKRKKRSPSSTLDKNDSVQGGPGGRQPSTSRISNAANFKNPKLRDTLNQNLHFVQKNVKVPTKQTKFYDDVHVSHITEQLQDQWRIKNNTVNLDEFDTEKKKIPVNRHRIPRVEDANFMVGSGAPKKGGKSGLGPQDGPFIWDERGRRVKAPKNGPGKVIPNASLNKVDFPRIKPGQKGIISPSGVQSMPSGLGKQPKKRNVPDKKFIKPSDKYFKQMPPAEPYPIDDKASSQPNLIDIDIRPVDPETTIHEPPIYDNNPTMPPDRKQKSPRSRRSNSNSEERPKIVNENQHQRHQSQPPQLTKPSQPPQSPQHRQPSKPSQPSHHSQNSRHSQPSSPSRPSQHRQPSRPQIPSQHSPRSQHSQPPQVTNPSQPPQNSQPPLPPQTSQPSEHSQHSQHSRPSQTNDDYGDRRTDDNEPGKRPTTQDNHSHPRSISRGPKEPSGVQSDTGLPNKSPTESDHPRFQSPFSKDRNKYSKDKALLSQDDQERGPIRTPPQSKGILKDHGRNTISNTKSVRSNPHQNQDSVRDESNHLPPNHVINTNPNTNPTNQDHPTNQSHPTHQTHPSVHDGEPPDIRSGNDDRSASRRSGDGTETRQRSGHRQSRVGSEKPGSHKTAPGVQVQKQHNFSETVLTDDRNRDENPNNNPSRRPNGSQDSQGSQGRHIPRTDDGRDYQENRSSVPQSGPPAQDSGRFDAQSQPQNVADRSSRSKDPPHILSSDPSKNHQFSGNIIEDMQPQKQKSQNSHNSTSQVRFAQRTNQQSEPERNFVKKNNMKVMSSNNLESHYYQATQQEQIKAEYQSEHAHFRKSHTLALDKQGSRYDDQKRVNTTQGGQRKSTRSPQTKKIRSTNKSQGHAFNSQTSQKSKLGRGIFVPDDTSRRGSSQGDEPHRSNKSKSPEVKKVMERLTHHRVKIDSDTKLLINGREVLTHKGIKGNINKVGLGFGTGRHTSGRRLDLLKEVPNQTQEMSRAAPRMVSQDAASNSPINVAVNSSQMTPSNYKKQPTIKPRIHRAPIRMDAQTQHLEPDVRSEGCDPIPKSMRSEKISAHVSKADQQLSARTMTALPEIHSVGLSAKPISEASCREQGDQITEGRFDPVMVDTQVETDGRLLEEYVSKPKKDVEINTTPIIIGKPPPLMLSALVQTEPQVDEYNNLEEHEVAEQAGEPTTGQVNPETGSNSSLLDIPPPEEILEIILPPEPEDGDPYVDDWAESTLYSYVYQLHYERMVKKKLIRETIVQRPEIPEEEQDMSQEQRYEYNLNPEKLAILSYMECDYGQSALRHKSATYRNEEMLQDLYERCKSTIQVLNANMVRPDICDHILFDHYQEVTKKNVIKLLLRVKRLYDARNESVNILKLVMEVEAVIQPKSDLWRIMQDNSATPLKAPFIEMLKRALKILSNALTRITIFQQEHRLFKDEFKFNKREYREYIRDIGKIIGGFLKLKRQANPALQENGLLQEEHEEHTEQETRYEEWVQASLAEYGKLDLPNEEEITQTLELNETTKSKMKVSRIDMALSKHREEMKEKSEQMELNSKREVIEQMRIKSDKLQVIQQSSAQTATQVVMSEQYFDRMRESAHKRTIISRMNEERERRHAEGYQTPEEETRQDRMQPGMSLLKQQLKYDGEMEDLATVNNMPMTLSELNKDRRHNDSQQDSQQLIGRFQDSALSSAAQTNINMRKKPVLTGLPQGYKPINFNQYEFNPSDNDGSHLGSNNRYDMPMVTVNNLRGPSYQNQGMYSARNLPGHGRMSPSDGHTVAQLAQGLNQTQSAQNLENATEFTEQNDDEPNHIDIETDKSVLNVENDLDDEQTVNQDVEGEDADAKNGVEVINQNQIKIKYQQSPRKADQQQ